MTNGEAITRQYEVKDAETGEKLEGPFYVLRPLEDRVAETAVFCYAHLLNLEDGLPQAVAQPVPRAGLFSEDVRAAALWREALENHAEIPEDAVAQTGEQFASMATIGPGDGSMARALTLMRSMGYELAFVAHRKIGEERTAEAANELARMHEAEYERRDAVASSASGENRGG